MTIKLYDEVILTQDIIEENLSKGDRATLVDYIEHPYGGEPGVILEIFNAIGDSVAVLAVPRSAIGPLKEQNGKD